MARVAAIARVSSRAGPVVIGVAAGVVVAGAVVPGVVVAGVGSVAIAEDVASSEHATATRLNDASTARAAAQAGVERTVGVMWSTVMTGAGGRIRLWSDGDPPLGGTSVASRDSR